MTAKLEAPQRRNGICGRAFDPSLAGPDSTKDMDVEREGLATIEHAERLMPDLLAYARDREWKPMLGVVVINV